MKFYFRSSKARWRRLLYNSCAATLLCFLLGALGAGDHLRLSLQLLLFVLGAWAIFWSAITVHEIGHLVAGTIARMQLQCLDVGWFRVSKSNYDCSYSQRISSSIDMRPSDRGATLRQSIILTMGGPIASGLLLCARFLIASRYHISYFQRDLTSYLAHAAILVTAYIFLQSALREGAYENDVFRIKQYHKQRPEFEATDRFHQFLDRHKNTLVSQLPLEEIETLAADEHLHHWHAGYLRLLSLEVYIDQQNIDHSREIAEALMYDDELPASTRSPAAFIAATIRGFYNKDRATTEEAIAIWESLDADRKRDKLHTAALANADGDYATALVLIDEAVAEICNNTDPRWDIDAFKRSWDMVRERVLSDLQLQHDG